MRSSRHLVPEMKEGGVNVTPLIDVVMVLIVFFMLVAKIGVTTGADASIDPPETILGQSLKDLGNTLTLNVRGGPRLEEPIITALVEQGDREPREIKVTERRGGTLDRPLERVLVAFRETNPNAKLIVLAERDLQYHLLEQVLISAANAKVTNINFQTKQPPPGAARQHGQ